MDPIYLDYNATSPLSKSVSDWLKSGEFVFANPSSQHSLGKASRKIINECRDLIFKTFSKNEKDHRLFFHSGATEAINTFVYSFSETARLKQQKLLVCYSEVDHPAVTSLKERFYGDHVEFLALRRDENLVYLHDENFETLSEKKRAHPELTVLYHHLWVHNETGDVSDLKELDRFKAIGNLFIHVDCVQAPGKILDWRELAAGDAWTFSGHKFGALKGIGFTLFKKDLPYLPLITGGSQQSNMRSGTENPLGLKTLSLALQDVKSVDVSKTAELKLELKRFLENELGSLGHVVRTKNPNSNTIYFYLKPLTSDIALAMFDLGGLSLSAGSACSSGSAKASPVLLQMGLTDVSRNGLRISLNPALSSQELKSIQDRLRRVISRLVQK